MGFFSDIASEARRSGHSGTPPQPAAPERPEQHVSPQEPPPDPAHTPPEPKPVPSASAPAPEPAPAPEQPSAQSAHTPPPPEVKLTVGDAAQPPDDTAARQAHEVAEAKRKAEFDAKQAEKKAARQKQLDKIAAMNGAELLAAAMDRVATDTERLTRRNMKESVAQHIQAKCREDAAFAMQVMDPAKSMINCFKYINRRAQEYAEQEMKDNGIQRTGVYGLDVPDGLCYQWAEDYFNDPNAKEDHQNEEKYIPKPYVSAARKTAKGKADKKKSEKKKPADEKPKAAAGTMDQMSLM